MRNYVTLNTDLIKMFMDNNFTSNSGRKYSYESTGYLTSNLNLSPDERSIAKPIIPSDRNFQL